MEERLRSITKRIHWSLVLKAAVLGASWIYLPEWISVSVALVFYFSSFFRVRRMAIPSLSAIVLAHILGSGVLAGVFLGVSAFLILGLKELVFIDRRSAYATLVFLQLFFASFLLYEGLDAWSAWFPVKALAFAWLFWAMARGYLLEEEGHLTSHIPLVLGGMSFIFWEIVMAMGFLPLDFLYQAGIMIFTAFVFFEWIVDYSRGALVRNKILLYVSLLFILVTLIFSFAKWGL